jgi:hypothetical protein
MIYVHVWVQFRWMLNPNSVTANLEAACSPKTLEQALYATVCKTQEHHHLDVISSPQE